ncbi:DUF6751 family protein [Eubacterium limosum]|uniref:DUF6751 family protein n=1 Tax=Eubacterium limosum TaxID=1736 RepID=UPI0010642865|nr:DUF6751 family protein [Eubacterium limosum]
MKANADITVIHIDDEGTAKVERIQDVFWFSDRKTAPTDGGIVSQDEINIIIPKKAAPATLNIEKGDYVVKGSYEDFITEPKEALRSLIDERNGVLITSVQDNRDKVGKTANLKIVGV